MSNEVKSVEKKNSFDLKTTIMNCITFIIAVALKPVSAFKSKIKDYSDVKSAGILVLFVAVAEMVLDLLRVMISSVFVKKVNFFSGETKFSVSFENLKELNYFDLIVKNLFITIVVIAAVAGIYYIVSMIMKKNTNYFKLAAITAVSFVPVCAVSLVGTIVAYIYAPLATFLIFAAFVYSVFMFINAVNEEVKFDDADYKIYFHTICLTVIFIAAFYILSNAMSSMFNGLL